MLNRLPSCCFQLAAAHILGNCSFLFASHHLWWFGTYIYQQLQAWQLVPPLPKLAVLSSSAITMHTVSVSSLEGEEWVLKHARPRALLFLLSSHELVLTPAHRNGILSFFKKEEFMDVVQIFFSIYNNSFHCSESCKVWVNSSVLT